jgi:hypothetical protein
MKFAYFEIFYITFLVKDNFHCLKTLMDGWLDKERLSSMLPW